VIGYVLAIKGGRSDGSHPGRESQRGRGFGKSVRTIWKETLKPQRSTSAVNFGRRLALAFRCMFKLVDDRNHDEVGDS